MIRKFLFSMSRQPVLIQKACTSAKVLSCDLVERGKSIILVTHYPEDIIPEIERVVMIKEGKLFDDGRKEELLTSKRMSELFNVPLRIIEQDGYFSLVSEY